MAAYESIIILRSNLADDEVGRVIEKMKGIVEKNGGQVSQAENWGKRKLAYEVKKERKGTYVIFRFTGSGKVVSELEQGYRVEDSILKFLTVRAAEAQAGGIPSSSVEEGKPTRSRPGSTRDEGRAA